LKLDLLKILKTTKEARWWYRGSDGHHREMFNTGEMNLGGGGKKGFDWSRTLLSTSAKSTHLPNDQRRKKETLGGERKAIKARRDGKLSFRRDGHGGISGGRGAALLNFEIGP